MFSCSFINIRSAKFIKVQLKRSGEHIFQLYCICCRTFTPFDRQSPFLVSISIRMHRLARFVCVLPLLPFFDRCSLRFVRSLYITQPLQSTVCKNRSRCCPQRESCVCARIASAMWYVFCVCMRVCPTLWPKTRPVFHRIVLCRYLYTFLSLLSSFVIFTSIYSLCTYDRSAWAFYIKFVPSLFRTTSTCFCLCQRKNQIRRGFHAFTSWFRASTMECGSIVYAKRRQVDDFGFSDRLWALWLSVGKFHLYESQFFVLFVWCNFDAIH